MNRRQKIIVSVTGIFLVLLLLVGLTYAYFLTRITGNTNDKSISVSTANLAIVYGGDDGSVIGSGEKITPGTTFEPKTFTVTNNGNANTDYVVVIEESNVTYAETIEVDGEKQIAGTETTFESNDFTYTLTCESGCNSVQEPLTFPIEGGILVGNRLDVGETQTYSFTLTYNETGENQSNDMNKKLEAKINIKDITTINPYSDKPNTLAYNIINNAVALTNEEKSLGYAELVGAPYTKVASEISETISSTGYEVNEELAITFSTTQQQYYTTYATEYSINPETGKFSLVNPRTCLYSDSNCLRDMLKNNVNIYLASEQVRSIVTSDGSLDKSDNLDYVYRLTEAPEVSETENINLIVKRITNQPENVISTTQDEYGTSYYYRGAGKNNYVNFNRMCWRIVRIEGDGSVRMILADKDAECSEATLTKTESSIIGSGYLNYSYDSNGNNQFLYDYIGQPYVEGDGTHDPYDIEYWGENMMHIKRAYNVFLYGGTLEYTESGGYKGDGTDIIIKKEYAGFDEEKLDLLKNEKVCIGERSKTYSKESGAIVYPYHTTNRLYNNRYATLLCNGGDYTERSKMFPLTIDEVIFAGGILDHLNGSSFNYSSYLRENAMTDWWLLSYAGNWDENQTELAFTYYFRFSDGKISMGEDYYFSGIRPVISLIPNIELSSGDGSVTNPYVIG